MENPSLRLVASIGGRPGRRRHLGDTELPGGVLGSRRPCPRPWSPCCAGRCLRAPGTALGMQTLVSPVRQVRAPSSQVPGGGAGQRHLEAGEGRGLLGVGRRQLSARVGPAAARQARASRAWLSPCPGGQGAAADCDLPLPRGRGDTKTI